MRDRAKKKPKLLYKILIFFIIFLVLILIIGTIYGIQIQRTSVDLQENSYFDNESQTFSGIGQIRVSTADYQPGMVIIFVSFYFDPNNIGFSEELVLRIRDFREIISGFFSTFTLNELSQLDEDDIKTELLHRFNAILRLGKIETLFFIDYLIIS